MQHSVLSSAAPMAGRFWRSLRHLSHVFPKYQTGKTVFVRCLSTPPQSPPGVSDVREEDPHFPGCHAKFTNTMKFVVPDPQHGMPIYHVLDTEGHVMDPEHEPQLDKCFATKMYKTMTLMATIDRHLCRAEKQGRICLYVANYGEEATHIGSAAALDDKDLVFAQYREPGVLLWRGYPIEGFMNQCFANSGDTGKGRQMPICYGSPEHAFMTISYPLGTQMPQATGAAYAFKRKKNGLCVACYFGDGTASEGDAHAGLNFAAALECPIIFFCRNNGYAISTKPDEQYRGDGIVARGIAYGMHSIRVDGNDVFAVYNAMKAAREIAVCQEKPVLIEAMTYRISPHTTSDFTSEYRSSDEVNYWANEGHPIHRLQLYLMHKNWWSVMEDMAWIADCDEKALEAVEKAHELKRPNPEFLFTDVYDKMPKRLVKQRDKMKLHVMKYKDQYPLDAHEKWE